MIVNGNGLPIVFAVIPDWIDENDIVVELVCIDSNCSGFDDEQHNKIHRKLFKNK